MRSIFKYFLIIGVSVPAAFATTYFSYPVIHPAETKEKVVLPVTKFSTKLQNNFRISNAKVEITRDSDYESYIGGTLDTYEIPFTSEDKLNLAFDGDIAISSMNFSGNLSADLNNKPLLGADFVYDGSKVYLGLNLENGEWEKSLKFTASSLLDVIKLIPMDGMGDLTEKLGLGEINASELAGILSKITDVSEEYAEKDEYFAHFALPLSFLKNTEGEEFSLIFCADEEYKPISIFCEHPAYLDGFILDINVAQMEILDPEFTVPAPNDSSKFRDLDPVVTGAQNIIPQIIDLIDEPLFDVSLEANIYASGEKEMGIAGNFSINVPENIYDISLDVKDEAYPENKGINVKAKYQNKTTYINFNDGVLKGSIKNESVNDAIDEVEKLLNKDLLTFLKEKINEITASEQVKEIAENWNSVTKILNNISLNWDENNIYISINAEDIGLETGVITLSINHNTDGLNYIKVTGLKYKDYSFDFKLGLHEKSETVAIDDLEEYQDLGDLTSLIGIIPSLIEQKTFTLGGNIYLLDSETNKKSINVDLNAQFDLNESAYYGNIVITDPDTVKHRIDVLYENDRNIYLKYDNADRLNDSSSIKAKANIDSIDETYVMIMDFINYLKGDDKKTESLFATLENIFNNPAVAETIRQVAMNLDSEKLNIQLEKCDPVLEDGTTNILTVNLNLALFGLDDTPLSVSIGFSKTELTYLQIHDANIDGIGILGGKIYLEAFSDDLSNSRISSSDSYYNFDDIKVLLKFAINTASFSQQNYWFVDGKFDFRVLGIDIEVPYQIYIKNNDTKIEISMRLTISGTIMGLGKALFAQSYASSKRYVSLYYLDGNIYIHRKDTIKDDFLGIGKTDYSTLYSMTLDDLLKYDEPIHVVTKDILDFSSTITDAIDDSINKSKTDEPMKYEQILKEFTHSQSNREFFISLNSQVLTNNEDMTKLDLYITYKGENLNNYVLDTLKVYMIADVGIDLKLDFELTLKDYTKDYESFFMPGYEIQKYCHTSDGSIYSSVETPFYRNSPLNFGETWQ